MGRAGGQGWWAGLVGRTGGGAEVGSRDESWHAVPVTADTPDAAPSRGAHRRRAAAWTVGGSAALALALGAGAPSSGPALVAPSSFAGGPPDGSSTGPSTGSSTGPSTGQSTGPAASPGATPGATTLPASRARSSADAVLAPAALPGLTTAQTACARAVRDAMPRADRAAQVLMVGVPASSPSAATAVISRHHVGGIFLAGRSGIDASILRKRLDAVQATARRTRLPGVHVAVDQEGGRVQTLSGTGFTRLPTARTQGTWPQRTLRLTHEQSARNLRRAGVTLNLAPVADVVPVALRRTNPPIGAVARDFGPDPRAVAQDVATVVTAGRTAGVATAVKHFPGLGRVSANTDTSTRAIDGATTATDAALTPFRAAVRAGTPVVMISSARYPRLDRTSIAAFSPRIVTELLRRDLGFTGVAVSDDLGSAKAVAGVPVGRRAVAFVAAGGDLVLTVQPAHAPIMRQALLDAAAARASFARRLDEAALRVVAGKVSVGLVQCTADGTPR